MKRYIAASTREDLMDRVDSLYDYAMEYCDERVVEGILLDNGASEDDEGPEGYLTGVTDEQLHNIIYELEALISRVKGEESYSFQLSESEIDLIIQGLESIQAPNHKVYEQINMLRYKFR